MKRFLTILFTAVLLTAALCVTASASDYDAVAKDLSAIGMFRGTAGGFELDRAPTRSEAAIMLVRLYGAEEEAKAAYEAGEIRHPFNDVSDFAAPYVAWVYTNGISNGTSATTFGSADKCSAQNYVVFLLRALGYKDGTDFQYAEAKDFAVTKGLMDLSFYTGEFLRDDLAAVTYQALACDLADGSTYLLDSLIQDGAVDADAAKPITEKITNYQALLDATYSTMQNSIDANISMKMDMGLSFSGSALEDPEVAAMLADTAMNDMNIALDASGRVQMILAEEPQMAMTLKMNATAMGEKESGEVSYWLKDGWVYIQVTESGETFQAKYQMEGLDEFMETYQELMQLSTQIGGSASLPYIDSITVSKSGSNTVYTVTYSNGINGLFDDILGAVMAEVPDEDLEGLGMSLSLDSCSYTYTLNSKGELKACTAVLDMNMGMDMSDEEIGSLSMVYNIKADVKMDINATDSGVKIQYPSKLSKFPEIVGGNSPLPLQTA